MFLTMDECASVSLGPSAEAIGLEQDAQMMNGSILLIVYCETG